MEEAEGFLLRLTGEEQRRLLNAIQTIEDILDDDSKPPTSYLFRLNSPGDIGWIIHRHGVVYSEEYGFDETFEALVEEILVQFIRKHDPKRECIWIAEKDGEHVGSIIIVDAGEQIAQLHLLLVEPRARGVGASASSSSTSASNYQDATATEKSSYGLRATCWKHAICMRKQVLKWLGNTHTKALGLT